MSLLSHKFFKSGSAFFAVGLVALFAACGDDSSTSSSGENGNVENRDDAVSTVKDLDACNSDNKYDTVYVESADARYYCNGKTWKIVENDEIYSDNKPTSSSAKTHSSSSTVKAKSSASTAKTKSSASTKTRSSDSSVIPSNAEGSSSSSTNSSSSVKQSSQVTEVAMNKSDLEECTLENKGSLVLVQSEMTFYRCNGTEYVEEDEDDLSSSSVRANSSDSDVIPSSAEESSSSSVSEQKLDLQKNTEGLTCVMGDLFEGQVDKDHFYYCIKEGPSGNDVWYRATDAEIETWGEECAEGVLVKGKVHEDKIFSCNREESQRFMEWHEATEIDMNTVGEECVLGKLIRGAIDKYKTFVCQRNYTLLYDYWTEATEKDLDLNERRCTVDKVGEVIEGAVNKNAKYVCRETLLGDFIWVEATVTDIEMEGEECVVGSIIKKDEIMGGRYYVCVESDKPKTVVYEGVRVGEDHDLHWEKMTRLEADTRELVCEDHIVKGTINENIDYSCINGKWHVAEKMDYDVVGKTCVEGIPQVGNVNSDRYYVCKDGYWDLTTKIERNIVVLNGETIERLKADGSVQQGLVDTDDYFVYKHDKWYEADIIESREAQGIQGCSEAEEGTIIRKDGFTPVYCKGGELSYYIEKTKTSFYYFEYFEFSRSYTFVNPYVNAWISITCLNETEGNVIGTLDGAEYHAGETIMPMPETVVFKPGSALESCNANVDVYIMVE